MAEDLISAEAGNCLVVIGEHIDLGAVGDDSAAYLVWHLVVLPHIRAVLVHGLSPVRRRPPRPVVAICIGMG